MYDFAELFKLFSDKLPESCILIISICNISNKIARDSKKEVDMKNRSRTEELIGGLKWSIRPLGALLFAAILIVGLFGKQTTHAASDRAKKVAGVFIGGGTGGGIAAIAGSAKWFPLGFGVGGLAGGLIARHVIKKRRERSAARAPYSSRKNRKHTKDNLQFEQESGYPARIPARRHVKEAY